MTARAVHVAAVAVATAGWIGLALSAQLVADPTEFMSVPEGWRPPAAALAIWALGLIGLASASWNPLAGLVVLFLFEYAVPRYTLQYQLMLQLHLPELTALLTLAGWLVWRRQTAEPWPSGGRAVWWLLAALILWAGISAAAAALSGDVWHPARTQHPLRYLVAAVAFIVAATCLRRPIQFAIGGLVLGACVLLRALLTPGGVRLDGDLGALVAVAAPLSVAALLLGGPAVRVCAGLAAASLVGILTLTRNRGGVVGLAAAGVALLALAPSWRTRALAVLALAAALALPLSHQEYRGRFEELWAGGVRSGSAGERLDLWDTAGRMVRDHPWSGVGPGNFPSRVQLYRPDLARLGAHNTVIAMFAETGVIGGTLFVLLFGSGLVLAARTAWLDDGWRATAAMAVGGALVGYLGAGMFVGRQTQIVAYVLLGAVVALRSRYSTQP